MNLGLATGGLACGAGSSLSLITSGFQCPVIPPAASVIIDISDIEVCGGTRIAADDPRLAVFMNGELLKAVRDYVAGPGVSQISLFRTLGPLDVLTVRRL